MRFRDVSICSPQYGVRTCSSRGCICSLLTATKLRSVVGNSFQVSVSFEARWRKSPLVDLGLILQLVEHSPAKQRRPPTVPERLQLHSLFFKTRDSATSILFVRLHMTVKYNHHGNWGPAPHPTVEQFFFWGDILVPIIE